MTGEMYEFVQHGADGRVWQHLVPDEPGRHSLDLFWCWCSPTVEPKGTLIRRVIHASHASRIALRPKVTDR